MVPYHLFLQLLCLVCPPRIGLHGVRRREQCIGGRVDGYLADQLPAGARNAKGTLEGGPWPFSHMEVLGSGGSGVPWPLLSYLLCPSSIGLHGTRRKRCIGDRVYGYLLLSLLSKVAFVN